MPASYPFSSHFIVRMYSQIFIDKLIIIHFMYTRSHYFNSCMLVQCTSNYFFDALEGSYCDFILLPVSYGKLTNIISITSLIIII